MGNLVTNNGWSTEVKIGVVEEWLTFGSLKKASEKYAVPYVTVKSWKASDWWKDIEDEIASQKRIETQNKISSVVDAGIDVVKDRLEKGDFFYDVKTGKVARKPVTLRDAASATNGLMQRQAILEKQNAQYHGNKTDKTTQELLLDLAEQFKKFANKSKQNAETIEYRESSDEPSLRPEGM